MMQPSPPCQRMQLGAVLVEPVGGAIRISIPPRPVAWVLESVILLYGAIAAACLMGACLLGVESSLGMIALFYSCIIALVFGVRRVRQRHAAMTVLCRPTSLEIEVWGVLWNRRLRWRRENIAAVGAWDGLLIRHTDGRTECLFSKTPLTTQRTLAALMQDYWTIGERLPLAPGGIAVQFTGSFWDAPVPGVLRVWPGSMALFHSLSSTPHLNLHSGAGGPLPPAAPLALVLQPTDVVCRVEDGGRSVLEVAPDGVRAEIKDGKPRLRIPIVGPLLHRLQDFPAGCVLSDDFADRTEEFNVTIWSEDPEALQAALGRFWQGGAP